MVIDNADFRDGRNPTDQTVHGEGLYKQLDMSTFSSCVADILNTEGRKDQNNLFEHKPTAAEHKDVIEKLVTKEVVEKAALKLLASDVTDIFVPFFC
jgi:hypothetical protein